MQEFDSCSRIRPHNDDRTSHLFIFEEDVPPCALISLISPLVYKPPKTPKDVFWEKIGRPSFQAETTPGQDRAGELERED